MNAFTLLHFIRPYWLLLLPLVIVLPWWWHRSRRPSGDWSQVCDPHLLRWLSVRQAGEKSRGGGRWLAAATLLICILALAGPSWQKLPDSSFSARDARVIVLDLSRSMLAEDLRPNRLTRARFRLADLLQATEEGQTGMVSFAGDAYVVSPLTKDMNTIANLLPALQPDIIPVAGSRADLALALAASLLERAGLSRGEILLVTDSANSRLAAKARELRDDGIFTSVLAVGSLEGAPVPSAGGFVSDRAGNVVIAKLDRTGLRAVAEAGGGNYTELGASGSESSLWQDLGGSEFARREDALGERWKDAGPWLVSGCFMPGPRVQTGGMRPGSGRTNRRTGLCNPNRLKKQLPWPLILIYREKPGIEAVNTRMPSIPGRGWIPLTPITIAATLWPTWASMRQQSRLTIRRFSSNQVCRMHCTTVNCSKK